MKKTQKLVQKINRYGIKKVTLILAKRIIYSDGIEEIYLTATQIKWLILQALEMHLTEAFHLHYLKEKLKNK